MGIERFNPTDEQRQFLVTAMERDNAVAVSTLLKRFGMEVWLKHREVEPRKTGAVFRELQGTVLSMAAYLRKDALAVSLLKYGAEPQQSYFYNGVVGDEDCDVTTVTVIGLALQNELSKLTLALMERPKGIDWNHRNAYSAAGSITEYHDDTLFDSCRRFEATREFLGKVGIFAGQVGQSMVRINGVPGYFKVVINDVDKGYFPTMGAGLDAVARELGMEPIVPLPPPPAAPVARECDLLSCVEDDIPY